MLGAGLARRGIVRGSVGKWRWAWVAADGMSGAGLAQRGAVHALTSRVGGGRGLSSEA